MAGISSRATWWWIAGSVGVAATSAGRDFAGCDIAAEAVEVTRERL